MRNYDGTRWYAVLVNAQNGKSFYEQPFHTREAAEDDTRWHLKKYVDRGYGWSVAGKVQRVRTQLEVLEEAEVTLKQS